MIIQTAFIGDVVLATALIEKLHQFYPQAGIDVLVRKGNETLLSNNPFINHVLVWNKKENKTKHLFALLKKIRQNEYTTIVNVQRYFSSGLLAGLSGAKEIIGFTKNPLSFLFTKKVKHLLNKTAGIHEVERNNNLIKHLTDGFINRPVLYPSLADEQAIAAYQQNSYITVSPTSVWFTKQYPMQKWIDFIDQVTTGEKIYLLGSTDNKTECDFILQRTTNKHVTILAGQLSFLQSAALMQKAVMNFTNDSAPLHFASAMNAPIAAIFCSTVPEFGYAPMSDKSFVLQTTLHLPCKPCGLHGYKACPLQHFKCAHTITTGQLLNCLNAN